MNYKTTKKAIMNGYSNVIYTGYCNLQNMLHYRNCESHTERAEGWGADVYHVNNSTCIVTGYAPFGNIHADYETCKRYDERARNYITHRDNNVDASAYCDTLIQSFVDEVTS